MTAIPSSPATDVNRRARFAPPAWFNLFMIGVMAFLTVVDLFATQAILPALAARYAVSPAAMAGAVNASTLGMAASGLLVALFNRSIPRRAGIVVSLAVLAAPTALLSYAPDLTSFSILRVMQGLCMSAAFTLTLAHLGERCAASASPAAFAAYVTGNVASNLIGRLIAAGAVSAWGIDGNFFLFSALNLAGAVLAAAFISRAAPKPELMHDQGPPWVALRTHLINPQLRIGFAIGFLILFAFIGAYSYVNFVLVAPPFALGMATLGLVYFVFLPALFTTPFAGAAAKRWGARGAIAGSLALSVLGLALTLTPNLPLVLVGLAVVGAGTFFAQAGATGFVSRAAQSDKAAASGLYLAFYYVGGLVGANVLGAVYTALAWPGVVACTGAALFIAAALAALLREPGASQETSHAHA
ncbi:MAG: MFS transporter [Alphaproteobacteria bacterium]|nr:MFS transporter [Alphaproteobacteria bacterium]